MVHHTDIIKRDGRVFSTKNLIFKELSYLDLNSKIILEIGAGTGNLTEELLDAKYVYAVEKIERLCEILQERITKKNVKIVCANFLDYELPNVDMVIGNIPYNLSSPILKKLISNKDKYDECYLMVQKEFAKKLIAQPDSKYYMELSVLVQNYYDVEYLQTFSPSWFIIRPKVKSAFIKLTPNSKQYSNKYETFIHELFLRRRKMLKKGLKEMGLFDKNKLKQFESLFKHRIFKLDIEQLNRIYEVLFEKVSE